MLLHCGGEVVDRDEVYDVRTPTGTNTWYPLSHSGLLTEVESQLQSAGFTIANQGHALSHEGARYFGVLEVTTPGNNQRDYGWIVGIRNSHDKSYPAGLVAGSKVFVCDNLAFTGEVKISRKHTRFAQRDLRHLTSRAVGQLGERFHALDERINAYREKRVTEKLAHDTIVKALDCRAIMPSQIPAVLQEWRHSEHEEFHPRNAWSLFNACTETFKGINPHTVVNRSQALHGLFDGLVGLSR
ncbi:MAG: DUF932 domain-containing protein [Verrucomicrobiales bacterium]|nr:DUF932 domain-containing protein [Verrucomicrobiales bacterium]